MVVLLRRNNIFTSRASLFYLDFICLIIRPFTDSGGFPTAVKTFYLVDIFGKHSFTQTSFGIRLLQYVIKTKADEL